MLLYSLCLNIRLFQELSLNYLFLVYVTSCSFLSWVYIQWHILHMYRWYNTNDGGGGALRFVLVIINYLTSYKTLHLFQFSFCRKVPLCFNCTSSNSIGVSKLCDTIPSATKRRPCITCKTMKKQHTWLWRTRERFQYYLQSAQKAPQQKIETSLQNINKTINQHYHIKRRHRK